MAFCPNFFWGGGASQAFLRSLAYNEWLLVDVVEIQGHQEVSCPQVEPLLVLIHQQDPIVTGVEGKAKRTGSAGLQQLWGETTTESRAEPKLLFPKPTCLPLA